TISTQGGRLAAVSSNKIYLRSYNRDLFLIDRTTGRTLVDPGESHVRAGVNLREYDLSVRNRVNDRLYFGTSSGLVLCLRDAGRSKPGVVRDPSAPRFGYVPPEGIKPPQLAPEPKGETAPETDEAATSKEKEDANAAANEKKDAPKDEPKNE